MSERLRGVTVEVVHDPAEGVEFGVTAFLRGGTLRAQVVGDVDLGSAPRLTAMLHASQLTDVYRLELDLSGVTFFSCAGMDALAGIRRPGLHVRLTEAAPTVRRLLGLLPMDDVLPPPE